MFAYPLAPGAELRPLEPWNAAEFAAHLDRAREHIRPWVGPAFVTNTVEEAGGTLARYARAAARDGARLFGIWAGDCLVGGVMFVAFDAEAGSAEIGCWLEPDAESHGLVTLAARVLLDWAFSARALRRVEWRCRTDNIRSAAVARRLGMTLEGTMRQAWLNGGIFHDKQIWAVLAREWASAPSTGHEHD